MADDPQYPKGFILAYRYRCRRYGLHQQRSQKGTQKPIPDSLYSQGSRKYVSISPQIDEHRFGVIPLHTTVAQRLLQQIRPQVERGFENDKNKLSLHRFFANSLKMAKIIGYLADLISRLEDVKKIEEITRLLA